MVKRKDIRKYIILPSCLLVLNVGYEVIIYKSQLIAQPYLRTTVILLLFLFGFGVVGCIISPFIERWMESLYYTGRKQAGYFGEILIIALLATGLFILYHAIYINGVESIIPRQYQNSASLNVRLP